MCIEDFIALKLRRLFSRTSKRQPSSSALAVQNSQSTSKYSMSNREHTEKMASQVTPGAVRLWLGLPDEVKYDPALRYFRYAHEHRPSRNPSTTNPSPQTSKTSRTEHGELLMAAEDADDFDLAPEEDTKEVTHLTKVQQVKKWSRMAVLIACWLYFTIAFLICDEQEDHFHPTYVEAYGDTSYDFYQGVKMRLRLEIEGPFLSEAKEAKIIGSDAAKAPKLEFSLTSTPVNDATQFRFFGEANTWKVLLDPRPSAARHGEHRASVVVDKPVTLSHFTLNIRNTDSKTVAFRFNYMINPVNMVSAITLAGALLVGLYILIITEIINRTMASLLMSTCGLASLALVGERPSMSELISWLDMETLLLLFSMMLLVAIMAETGLFDYLAVFSFEKTKGMLWPMITLLCGITAVFSMFLDNVTTVMLMGPVTIRLCEVMELHPVPILMSIVIFSNIGGTATPVGDPPNVIISSNKNVRQAGVTFIKFTSHMIVGVFLVAVQTYFQLRYIYKDPNNLRSGTPRHIQEIQKKILLWTRTAEGLQQLTEDEITLHSRLEKTIRKLQRQLDIADKESRTRTIPKANFKTLLNELKDKYHIRDKVLLIKSGIAIGFCIVLFFLNSIPSMHKVSLGWVALLGAILLLLLADWADLEPILHRVEWSTLLFFACLFVLMEVLTKLGLIKFIGGITEEIIMMVDDKGRLAVAILIVLWVSGISSAFVDNIPLTSMMVRVVCSLGDHPAIDVPQQPLIWALAFGACLGGNGTLIGASANVVCAGVAEQHGYKITFRQFFKLGFPIMLANLTVISVYLLFCHCVFHWNE